MEQINARSMLEAAATSAAAHPPVERRRRLTPPALTIANEKVGRAYSAITIGE